MDRGLDTTFLVQVEVLEHAGHVKAKAALDGMLWAGDRMVVAPQVLTEFVHVVTDPRRFAKPLEIGAAMGRAEAWWSAAEVRQVFPDDASVRLFASWMREHRLGRKRLLDTLLAATYRTAGVDSILSTNARDYAVFGCFDVVVPGLG